MKKSKGKQEYALIDPESDMFRQLQYDFISFKPETKMSYM